MYYPKWTPPHPYRNRKKTTPNCVIPDQLFSHTLHSYDFERKTWYPYIKVDGVPKYKWQTPPSIDPMIQERFSSYEHLQFKLLSEKYICQKEYEVNACELIASDRKRAWSSKLDPSRPRLVEKEATLKERIDALDKKIESHAIENATLLDIINIHILMEKDYAYSVEYQVYLNDILSNSSVTPPTRKEYVIINPTLPFNTPSYTPIVEQRPTVYRPPVFVQEDANFIASPDMNSKELFPSLG